MNKLVSYEISGTCSRGVGGFTSEYTDITLTFCKSDDSSATSTEVLSKPIVDAFDGENLYTDVESAADVLDDFVYLNSDVTVVANPTPDEGNPRLVIFGKGATPKKVIIY